MRNGRSSSWLCFVLLIAIGADSASASDQPFARFVPAHTSFFATSRRLADVNALLHRSNAFQAADLLSGSRSAPPQIDLRAAIALLLGHGSSVNIDELVNAEIGVIADSWTRFNQALWFVRVKNEKTLRRWFPSLKKKPVTASIRCFRTANGLEVCVKRNVVLLARRKGDVSLLRATRHLMAGTPGASLADDPVFQQLTEALPHNPFGYVYMAEKETQSPSATPVLSRLVAGVYQRAGNLEVVVRGKRHEPANHAALSVNAISRWLRLPATSLAASVATTDANKAFAASTEAKPTDPFSRYVRLLLRFARSDTDALPAAMGPHLITVWGADLDTDSHAPQLAILLESDSPARLRDLMMRAGKNIVKLIASIDEAAVEAPPTFKLTTHLGVPVFYLPLAEYGERSDFPLANLLGSLEPAWAASKGWFILATSRVHLERILDAQNGLAPTMAQISDVRALCRGQSGRTLLAWGQLTHASEVLDQWLESYDAGKPSLLHDSWWSSQESAGTAKSLGIAMGTRRQPGVVVVSRVYAGGAAEGVLQPGDRIIGFNGELLNITIPKADLRRRLVEDESADPPTLRVIRGDKLLDVALRKQERGLRFSNMLIKPADAIRELASVGRSILSVTYLAEPSDPDSYAARVSVRFAPHKK